MTTCTICMIVSSFKTCLLCIYLATYKFSVKVTLCNRFFHCCVFLPHALWMTYNCCLLDKHNVIYPVDAACTSVLLLATTLRVANVSDKQRYAVFGIPVGCWRSNPFFFKSWYIMMWTARQNTQRHEIIEHKKQNEITKPFFSKSKK